MQAVILAAGMGKRLKEYTKDNTKCMVKVNGITLIERMLRQLDERGMSKIVIVVGYEREKLMAFVRSLEIGTPVFFVENDIYDKTNNIYSLYLAKDYLCGEDTLLLESDVIFDDSVLDSILSDERKTLALVAKYESWMDGTCIKLKEDDSIADFISGKKFRFEDRASYFKTVNIYKFSRHFSVTHYCPFLEAYTKAIGNNEYYEQVLKVITMLDEPEIEAKRLCSGQKWYEIDDVQDLDIAETLFETDTEKRLAKMQKRYGGYWRYPEMLDFCYLVNPYFPSAKLMHEMAASFDDLLTQYPSGMEVNSLLASKNFGIPQNNIVVANGAAELIKSYMEISEGRTGFIRPSFEEYYNRCSNDSAVCFYPENKDKFYDEDDIISFFEDEAVKGNKISNLILVNPDNPSGNYIDKDRVMKLISWTKEKKIRLVLDESFGDFAEEEDNSFLKADLLMENPHLCVVKSISKSYGVPGLRLGVMACSDAGFIEIVKKDVSIWNINSFAEFFMQILGKYQNDYLAALDLFKKERARFGKALGAIKYFRLIPSQANYFMCELTGDISAKELACKLLEKHNILIKELTKKVGDRYVRIAVRNAEDDDRLVEALKEIMVK